MTGRSLLMLFGRRTSHSPCRSGIFVALGSLFRALFFHRANTSDFMSFFFVVDGSFDFPADPSLSSLESYVTGM
jgi:hypothetical protein